MLHNDIFSPALLLITFYASNIGLLVVPVLCSFVFCTLRDAVGQCVVVSLQISAAPPRSFRFVGSKVDTMHSPSHREHFTQAKELDIY